MISKKNILSFFLMFIFSYPIIIEGVHDTFYHDYSHQFEHNNDDDSISDINHLVCYIHGFKYFSFEKYGYEVDSFYNPIKNFAYLPYLLLTIDNKVHSCFLQRGPPVIS